MDLIENFRQLVAQNIRRIGEDRGFLDLSNAWVRASIRHSYAQNFSWLGRPVIQVPQDLYAIQELIWTCRPDLVIETGIAHGPTTNPAGEPQRPGRYRAGAARTDPGC